MIFRYEDPSHHPLFVTYMLLLNTLYGKTFQAIGQTDYEEEPELVWNESRQRAVRNRILYRAGGLYLPHVATAGRVRRRFRRSDRGMR